MPDRYRHASRLFALWHAGGALLLLGMALWLYLMGEYERIPLPAALSLLMVVATLLNATRAEHSRLAAYLALICGYLLIAVELPRQSGLPALWVGLPPVLTLLLLPLAPAMLLNLALTPVWLALLGNGQLDGQMLLGYLSLVAVAALVPWEQARQHALIRATDPRDAECAATGHETLHEQLASEVERAKLLGQPLGLLLMHLPQLDMAGEQFGPGARQALLDTLCQAVSNRSRDHDILGRHGPADFWLILPDTSESGALLVQHRLGQALEQTTLMDTGPLEVRLRLCRLRAGEPWPHFEQRLETCRRSLADG
ncbi:GGDEF domain-containing protein [Halomonas saccharevitans]|uniref:GGDEF domain-containing protein n=1 Tax=Halomonas saccharevitans TaxID=416872 RepID=A0ABU3NBF7_9GAMM|nr:GGDEF domain-containing protein [Halomonas saccharevitans]MDT8878489.1 GGDEF domain-containing protein [Halomonas saccharevitans]